MLAVGPLHVRPPCGRGVRGGCLPDARSSSSRSSRPYPFLLKFFCTIGLSKSKIHSLLSAMSLSKATSPDTGVCCVPNCGKSGTVGEDIKELRKEDTDKGMPRQLKCKDCVNARARVRCLMKSAHDDLKASMKNLSAYDRSAMMLEVSIEVPGFGRYSMGSLDNEAQGSFLASF